MLIDITITGSTEAPAIEPQNLQFTLGQEYVLVATNERPYSVVLFFAKFGQSLFTRQIHGTGSVSQDSLQLNANSKVTWHFVPHQVGEYEFYAVNNGLNLKGRVGKISLTAPAVENVAGQTVNAKIAAAQPKKKHLKRWGSL